MNLLLFPKEVHLPEQFLFSQQSKNELFLFVSTYFSQYFLAFLAQIKNTAFTSEIFSADIYRNFHALQI